VRAIMFATPSLPFAPRPVGHCTDASAPMSDLNFELTLERYVVNKKFVPEPSER
jgi:hypothetical protein